MMNQQGKLYRSRVNKVVGGVCGGLGEYLNVDPTIIRLVWILLALFGGSGIIVYILAYFIIPMNPLGTEDAKQPTLPDFTAGKIFGIAFVIIGSFILLDNLNIISFHHWWNISWDYVLPSALIIAGIFFLTKRNEKDILAEPDKSPLGNEQKSQEQTGEPFSGTKENAKSKILCRSIKDRKFLGICGGLGEYFDIDPTIIRIGYVIFALLSSGIGIICYFLMYLIIPEGQPQTSI